VNDTTVPLNEFNQEYIGNVLKGIVASLGFSSGKIRLNLNGNELRIFSGDQEVPIKKEFVNKLVVSTVRGVIAPLKGIPGVDRLEISVSD
jgi:hypothetical protein